ncbi:bifunctional [glutamate--ammonia ligase]-adenylyl-L-tyrosine phosphorylase/[glutamate--ammonia-ligase] adenylyltransferase [Geopsychrobacter electrodiphilus]|uniref:bifunctional [glutamate--ammonia ligase]-adenylyl-L-tyrosine phosphorylase/[glutamate--ammonia-ligase] adenylyltransferase n=1 Tax=Geopsychrobacter electrodiphilus TaxID=225196 RepID=UPI00037E2A8A|nr:bifunctional [glutamate--ammonia ligase]-adenylyl-L-tyrosine phosphorylase/[glutamate--ammonia-ligase] adenylyltransferase [Geopsychrobacter electrodiphilus]
MAQEQFDRLSSLFDGSSSAELAIQLEPLGFDEPQRSVINLELLFEVWPQPELLCRIVEDSLAVADPDLTLNYLERLLAVVDHVQLLQVLSDRERRLQLLIMLGGSPFLGTLMCRGKRFFAQLFIQAEIDQACTEAQMIADLRRLIPIETPAEEADQRLRYYKAHQFLRIGGRDLCGLATLEEVTAELSGLAAAALQIAYEYCSYQLQQEYGEPLDEDGEMTEFTILGMGKLGGYELNFSSDIDLIYCYSTMCGQTSGGSRGEQVELRRYYLKLSEMITRALNQPTADGFVFRVDTRLRPDGNSGDLAISLNAAETYYESWGQSWERAAMIKARPVAGSIELGEELLARLEPFVYRRYLDFGMIEDIMLMKQKIDASLNRTSEGELNLKLGRGGIREIEFFIQAQQLVNGGKNRLLRERNSLKALTLLGEQGLVSPAEVARLQRAYRFLRTVEHRIQIVQERQTHSLPIREAELLALARRSGFTEYKGFEAALKAERDEVCRIYRDLFHAVETPDVLRPEVSFIFDHESDPDQVKDLLEERGFSNPDVAYQSLRTLHGDQPERRLTERGRRYLEQLAPLLLSALLDSPNPDQALSNLEAFLDRLHSRASFFALLAENPEIVKLLVSLFGSSQMLSRIFIQRPELLDTMVSRAGAVSVKPQAQMVEELTLQINATDSYEDQLEILRRFRNEEFLRIALNDLHGELGQSEGTHQLSLLAEVCLERAILMARKELIPRFGLPFLEAEPQREVAFGVVAMGKLGGYELNYHSDLDIIFLHEGAGTTRPVAGTDPERFRQLNSQEYFGRLAQRIISILTLVTREGIVYKIDTQLRPSGNQGSLVTGLDAFERYHRETAQPWERQSMTRARMICGPDEFLNRAQALIEELTFERELPEDLAPEICRLRQRMELEIAREDSERINIKTGRGGMVDVEFITQYLQLKHGRTHRQLHSQNTLVLLKALVKLKLLDKKDGKALLKGYKGLRRLENKLRLFYDQSMNELSASGAGLNRIARSLGYEKGLSLPEEQLLGDYHRLTENIRTIFERTLCPVTADN